MRNGQYWTSITVSGPPSLIHDLYTVTQYEILNSVIMFLDPKNVGLAVEISLLSFLETEVPARYPQGPLSPARGFAIGLVGLV